MVLDGEMMNLKQIIGMVDELPWLIVWSDVGSVAFPSFLYVYLSIFKIKWVFLSFTINEKEMQ